MFEILRNALCASTSASSACETEGSERIGHGTASDAEFGVAKENMEKTELEAANAKCIKATLARLSRSWAV